MTDQEFVPLREAARQVLREAGLNALRASGQQAYEAMVTYALLAWLDDPVWRWYEQAQKSAQEQGAFFSRWYAWQQEERHRLGLG